MGCLAGLWLGSDGEEPAPCAGRVQGACGACGGAPVSDQAPGAEPGDDSDGRVRLRAFYAIGRVCLYNGCGRQGRCGWERCW